MQVGLYLPPDKPGVPVAGLDDELPGAAQRRLDRFAALLAAGQTVYQVVPDIQVLRWEKVVWNAAWNALTTLTRSDTHAWLASSADAPPLTTRLMREVIAVARGLGVPLADALADDLVRRIRARPPIGSSMWADYERGRPLEVDAILGYPVRKGRELGLAIPTIETLFVLLTAINKRLVVQANEGNFKQDV